MKFCIPTAITCMALSFCSAAVGVAIRGSVAHENDIAELDLATPKHAGEYLHHTLDGTSTDANLIAPLVTDLGDHFFTCKKFAIKSAAHGTYLRAHPGGKSKVDTQTFIGPWEQFTIRYFGSGQYSIESAHGTYLKAYPGGEGSQVYLQTYVSSWAGFQIKSEDNGVYSLRSDHYTYVRAHPGGKGSTIDLQTYVGPWEKFQLICV